MRLALLSHASFPLHIWDHRFSTTVHVINKIPSGGLPKFHPPYHALYHELPGYESLKMFDYACFPFIYHIININ